MSQAFGPVRMRTYEGMEEAIVKPAGSGGVEGVCSGWRGEWWMICLRMMGLHVKSDWLPSAVALKLARPLSSLPRGGLE
nr:hypothetical protein CFP56_69479 [Quercus suber]